MSNSILRQEHGHKIEAGYKKIAESSVAICSIVRDCGDGLKKNIPAINHLMSCFKDAHVVIFENDSQDDTKAVLAQWVQSQPNVHVRSEDDQGITIPPQSQTGTVSRWFSHHRIQKMADYRNRYLEYLSVQSIETDYVIMVDLDLAEISIDGIADSFGQRNDWDAITSNGVKLSKIGFVYYDTYAFKETLDETPQTEQAIYRYQKLLQGYKPGMPMMRISSGFNGLAIYRSEAIKGIRYRSVDNHDPVVEAKCEHVTFHQDMSANGFDRIFFNPSMVVKYNTLTSILSDIKRRLF